MALYEPSLLLVYRMRNNLIFLILFLLSLSFAGCHRKNTNTVDKKTIDSTTLKVGLVPTFECLPFYIAEEKGLYDSIEARVAFYTFGAAMDADTAFRGRSVDGICTDLCHAVALADEGYNLNVIAATKGRQVLLGAGSVRIRKIKDLKERMIAVARGDQSKLFLQYILAKNKIGSDITYLPQINNFQIRYTMLCNGQIDAAVLPEPYATMAQHLKNKALADNDLSDFNLTCLLMGGRAQKEKNTHIRRLIIGYNMAVEEINKSKPGTFAGILTRYYNMPVAMADTFRLPKYSKASVPSGTELKRAVVWMQKEGLVSGKVKNLITDEYIH